MSNKRKNNKPESQGPEIESEDLVTTETGESIDQDSGQNIDSSLDDLNSDLDSQPSTESEHAVTPERIAALEHQVAELKDQYVRAHAETENIRKRAANEVSNGRKFAIEGFAKEILNVRDSLGLASGVELAEDQTDAVAKMREGLELTLRQLDGVLERFGVKAIDAEVGDKLDPEIHQAMSLVDGGEIAAGCIITVVQPGYRLHDRLLRAAMVVVAK